MNAILAALAADTNLDPAFGAAIAPQQHRATRGWHRVFRSAARLRQYEAGYGHWPEPLGAELGTPFSAGWFDRESDEQFKLDDSREEYMDREEDDK